jgi:hypothetical protein
MGRVLPAETAIFVHFQTVGVVFFVLHGVVVSLFAFSAGQCNSYAHGISLLTKKEPFAGKG